MEGGWGGMALRRRGDLGLGYRVAETTNSQTLTETPLTRMATPRLSHASGAPDQLGAKSGRLRGFKNQTSTLVGPAGAPFSVIPDGALAEREDPGPSLPGLTAAL